MYQNDHLTRTCPKRVLISVLLCSPCYADGHAMLWLRSSASIISRGCWQCAEASEQEIFHNSSPQLVGGLEHLDYFPYIGNNHPKWLIFFRGVGIPPIRKWWRIGRAEGDCSMLRGGAQQDARQAKVGHGIEHSSTVLGHFEGAKQQVVHFKIYMLHDRFDSMFAEAVIFAGKQIPLPPVRHGLFFSRCLINLLVGGFKHFFRNILDNPSHWLIFFKMVIFTNQININ